jgi:hypothetical protein
MYTKNINCDHWSYGFFNDNQKIQLENYTNFRMFNVDDYQNKFYIYDTELRTANLTPGYYSQDRLAIELQRAINAVSDIQMYAVTVINNRLKIEATQKFRIMMDKKHNDSLREATGYWSNTRADNIHIGHSMCIDRKLLLIGRGKLKGCFMIESGDSKSVDGKILYLINNDQIPYLEVINLSGHHPTLVDSIVLIFKGSWIHSIQILILFNNVTILGLEF